MYTILAFPDKDGLTHQWATLYAHATEPVEGGLVMHMTAPHSFEWEKFANLHELRYGVLSGVALHTGRPV